MKGRTAGYLAWLIAAGCLYFFENGAATRILFFCTLLVPAVPALRAVLEAAPGAEGGALVVGHQPDCGEILQYFCGGGQAAFKKCTLAVVEVCELRRAGGELLALVPSALQG